MDIDDEMENEKIGKVKCKRCGYVWLPRSFVNPVCCANPKCHSPYWNVERKNEIHTKYEGGMKNEL